MADLLKVAVISPDKLLPAGCKVPTDIRQSQSG
jgi:hypothetical protein